MTAHVRPAELQDMLARIEQCEQRLDKAEQARRDEERETRALWRPQFPRDLDHDGRHDDETGTD